MNISYIVLDVDGTLTDSGVYYDNLGNELKKFSTKDGVGFHVAHAAGIKIIVLTGRKCEATVRRMKELNADIIEQNIHNKADWIKYFAIENNIQLSDIGYIGDDVNDLIAMKLCGWIGCPADSVVEVKSIADYVSSINGGHGAVRDCIEHLLGGDWNKYVNEVYYKGGI